MFGFGSRPVAQSVGAKAGGRVDWSFGSSHRPTLSSAHLTSSSEPV